MVLEVEQERNSTVVSFSYEKSLLSRPGSQIFGHYYQKRKTKKNNFTNVTSLTGT